ncbi:MAG: RNA polymerase sigma factor [Oscillospiraceae bacterium]|nr:RNA polymerase sigma factor [Oscillospiraceae bacterium]
MTDEAIVLLLEQRDESALRAIESQYGGAGRNIAAQILGNEQDAQEIFQDTLMRLWNAIPPEHPDNLFAYLCTVLRNLAYNRQRVQNAKKRGQGQQALVLDELHDVIANSKSVEEIVAEHLLQNAMNQFLETLKREARIVFIQRYGNMRPITEIADLYDMSESKVKITLMRTRKKLKAYLEREGLL